MVSVVIPVYNGEKTVERCLKSVINQTYKFLDIIVIDDGSTDRSYILCQSIAEHDSRVRVFRQKNKGVSAARNKGIDVAEGEYIQFVDSDDMLKPSMVDSMVRSYIEGEGCLQLAICGMERRIRYKHRYLVMDIALQEEHVHAENISVKVFEWYRTGYLNAPVNKLYLKSIIGDRIRFDVNMALGEDLKFNIEYLEHCHYVKILSKCDYVIYEESRDSLMRKYNPDRMRQISLIYTILENYRMNHQCASDAKEINDIYYLRSVFICAELIVTQVQRKEQKVDIEHLLKYINKEIFKHGYKSWEYKYYCIFLNGNWRWIRIGVGLRVKLKLLWRILNDKH